MALTGTENNAYAKFWSDKQSALWYVIVFSEVVNQSASSKPFEFTPLNLWTDF